MQHILKIKNVKCGGCAAIIQNKLAGQQGVEKVAVDVAQGQVTIEGEITRDTVVDILMGLGYPEQDAG